MSMFSTSKRISTQKQALMTAKRELKLLRTREKQAVQFKHMDTLLKEDIDLIKSCLDGVDLRGSRSGSGADIVTYSVRVDSKEVLELTLDSDGLSAKDSDDNLLFTGLWGEVRAAQICVFLIANGASYDLEFIRYKQKCVAWMCSLAILVGIGVVTFFAAPSKADVFFVCGGVLMGVFFLPYWHEVAGKEIERRKDKMLRD